MTKSQRIYQARLVALGYADDAAKLSPAPAARPARSRTTRPATRRSREEHADYIEDVTGDLFAAESVRTGRR